MKRHLLRTTFSAILLFIVINFISDDGKTNKLRHLTVLDPSTVVFKTQEPSSSDIDQTTAKFDNPKNIAKVTEEAEKSEEIIAHDNTTELDLDLIVSTEGTDESISVLDQKTKVDEWLSKTISIKDGVRFEIVGKLSHDTNAFLEGLCFANGYLFESTGLKGQSDVRKIDPNTGDILDQVKMEPKYFGEGLAVVKDKLVQLTYKRKKGFIYDINNLQDPPEIFDYITGTGEGWGMTYDTDKDELILNDGNDYLIFWDPKTHTEKRKLKVVRQDGSPATQINELEFWRGRVLANVWYEDVILVINPETGECEKEYDFSSLAYNSKTHGAVLNGISVSDDPDVLFISGKLWETIFKVKLL